MIGEFGESLVNVLLSRRTTQGILFQTMMIGGKWPTIDIYAELTSEEEQKLFCFFQVKATEGGYTHREHKLRVAIYLKHLTRLSKFGAPTYLLGIDLNMENPIASQAFIGTIRGTYLRGLSSMPTTYRVNELNLISLKEEIIDFWSEIDPLDRKEEYITNFII